MGVKNDIRKVVGMTYAHDRVEAASVTAIAKTDCILSNTLKK